MRFIKPLAAALLALAAFAAQAQTKITIAHTGVAEYLSAYVALEEGIFRKHGLDVSFQQVAGGTMVPALQGGSVQMATLPPTNLLLAHQGGLDLVVVAGTGVFEKTDKTVGLLVGASSGVNTARDLAGKKVGVPSIGGSLYVLARKWITDKGVDPKQVNFVEVNFPQTGDLLKSGSIHAGVSAEPFLKRAVNTGAAKVLGYFPADLPPNTTGVVLATTRKWATQNPQAVKGFRTAIAEGASFAEKNPQAARAHLGKFIKLPPEVLASVPMPHLQPEVTEAQLRFWIDAMAEMGLTTTKADASTLIVR